MGVGMGVGAGERVEWGRFEFGSMTSFEIEEREEGMPRMLCCKLCVIARGLVIHLIAIRCNGVLF